MYIKKSISIVIPNYNGRRLLEEYLPHTLIAIKNAEVDYEVIIVDDCSTDESVKFIKTTYPDIKLLINPENKGFSYLCNQGIFASQYQLILLLNSDVKLAPNYFEPLWKYFLGWDTFGVMGRIMDMEGDHIQDAAHIPKLNGYKLENDFFGYTNDDGRRLYTLYLSSANALIDAEKLKQMGGFFEIFSDVYYEDMELSIRAWKLKWNCYYEHAAICKRPATGNKKGFERNDLFKSDIYRNQFYLQLIHLNKNELIKWYFQLTFDLVPKLLTGKIWAWKSYKELIKNRNSVEKYKAKVKKLMEEMDTQTTLPKIVQKIQSSAKSKRLVHINP